VISAKHTKSKTDFALIQQKPLGPDETLVKRLSSLIKGMVAPLLPQLECRKVACSHCPFFPAFLPAIQTKRDGYNLLKIHSHAQLLCWIWNSHGEYQGKSSLLCFEPKVTIYCASFGGLLWTKMRLVGYNNCKMENKHQNLVKTAYCFKHTCTSQGQRLESPAGAPAWEFSSRTGITI